MTGQHPIFSTDLDGILDRTAVWPSLREARLFITGGTGFFGRWLLSSLIHANRRLNTGMQAVVLTRDPAAFQARFPDLAGDPAVSLWKGDLQTFTPPPGAFSHVIHAAADTAPGAFRQPLRLFGEIIGGTRRVLDAAAAAGAGTVLLTSSGAVYGPQPADIACLSEDHLCAPDPTDLRSLYGQTKRASEALAVAWQAERQAAGHEAAVKIARCFAFAGPHLPLNGHFAIGNFTADVLAGRPITVQGDGSAVRTYLYAADLAVWLWTVLVRGAPAQAYNIGSDSPVSIAALAHALGAIGRVPVSILGKTVAGELRSRYVPDITRARTELGLEVTIGLDDAIRRTLAWHRGGAD